MDNAMRREQKHVGIRVMDMAVPARRREGRNRVGGCHVRGYKGYGAAKDNGEGKLWRRGEIAE